MQMLGWFQILLKKIKKMKEFPLRLSFSSMNTLQECERKFQLEKLLAQPVDKEESVHFSFGKGYGAGVQAYLVTRNKEYSLFQCWLNYSPVIEDDKKNQWSCLNALEKSFRALDNLLNEYEVAIFDNKPAVELSFRLNINETKYFVGHIDVVLKNRFSGKYFVMEIKSTGLQLLDLKPLYQHSGQALGYSIALDTIVGKELSNYGILYFVLQLPAWNAIDKRAVKTHVLPFTKTLVDRLNWFVSLGLDVQHLEAMQAINIFPKRHSACMRFNRVCPHFGTCSLQNFDIPKKFEEDPIDYQFTFELDDLIQNHVDRIALLTENKKTMISLESTTTVKEVA